MLAVELLARGLSVREIVEVRIVQRKWHGEKDGYRAASFAVSCASGALTSPREI